MGHTDYWFTFVELFLDLELKATFKLEVPSSSIEKQLRCVATWITIEPFKKPSDPINLL